MNRPPIKNMSGRMNPTTAWATSTVEKKAAAAIPRESNVYVNTYVTSAYEKNAVAVGVNPVMKYTIGTHVKITMAVHGNSIISYASPYASEVYMKLNRSR